jgi:hypothetical protein
MVLGKIAEHIRIKQNIKTQNTKHKTLLHPAEHSELYSHSISQFELQYQQKEKMYCYHANNALLFPSNHCCAPNGTAT